MVDAAEDALKAIQERDRLTTLTKQLRQPTDLKDANTIQGVIPLTKEDFTLVEAEWSYEVMMHIPLLKDDMTMLWRALISTRHSEHLYLRIA